MAEAVQNNIPVIPLAKFVVAQKIEVESRTNSGLYLPPTSVTEAPSMAKVLATGDQVTTVAVGDTIVHRNMHESITVTVGGEEYIIIERKNIISKIKETK